MKGDVTPSLPPADAGAATSPGDKKVTFNKDPDTIFVVVSRPGARGPKANRQRRNQVTDATGAAAPAPVPITALVSSTPTGAAMYSQVVTAPPPPPEPYTNRPGR